MAVKRTYGSYNDGCASAHALDLIGERWALIVVRELLLGPKRFVDIHSDIPGISPGPLAQRLKDLKKAGIVQRRMLPAPARVMVYDLTAWGRGLESVNAALSLWAVQSPQLPLDADMSPDTLVLAMRAHARPLPEGSPDRRIGLRLTDSRVTDREPVEYLARLSSHGTSIRRDETSEMFDAEVSATTRAWKALVIGGARLERAEGIAISGSWHDVQKLIDATKLEEQISTQPPQNALNTQRA